MIHLRIVAPEEHAHKALDLLSGSAAVINVVHLHAASKKPKGDVILCDVAREDASVIISDLKELDIPKVGSIAVEHDPDGGDLHRRDHEKHEAEGQLGLLGGARLDLLPHHRVRRQAGRDVLPRGAQHPALADDHDHWQLIRDNERGKRVDDVPKSTRLHQHDGALTTHQ
jgi:hypothetical protein